LSDGGLPDTIKRTAADVRKLATLQAELAKQRIQTQAKKKGFFAGMAAGGGVFALYSMFFLLGAAAAGLANVLPVWLALLLTGVGALLFGGMLVGIGAVGLRGRKAAEPATAEEEVEPWLRAKTP
jgi:hypothetical protein